jgi:phenylacetate-CoA ligase
MGGERVNDSRTIWNPEMESLSRQRLRALQEARLLPRIPYAYQRSALLREVWEAAGVHPSQIRSLEDFTARVPTIEKEMVRQYRDRTGDPFGGMSCLDEPSFDVHSSSGTTGSPTFLPITDRDVAVFAESLARHLWCAGLRPGETLSLSMGLYLRPLRVLHTAARRLGARVALTDWTDIPRLLHTFRYMRPAVHIFLTPPQALGLRDEMARLGLAPREALGSIRAFVWAGDAITPKTRRLVDDEWGSTVFDLSGTADLSFMMMECQAHDGLHAHDDLWLVEVVEPGTTTPVAPGARGEFLFTSLMDSSLAFLRWRSEDVGYVTAEPCVCGRTSTRMHFLGRVGYRVTVRGKMIFPVEIQQVMETYPEVEHGLFQIFRYASEMDRLRLRVGYRLHEVMDLELLRKRLVERLESALALPIDLEFVKAEELLALGPPHKIPRIHEAR